MLFSCISFVTQPNKNVCLVNKGDKMEIIPTGINPDCQMSSIFLISVSYGLLVFF